MLINLFKLHLKIIKDLHNYSFEEFNTKFEQMMTVIKHKHTKKIEVLRKKLQSLVKPNKENQINNYNNNHLNQELVYNWSKENFSNNEIELLNKGLKFCIENQKKDKDESFR